MVLVEQHRLMHGVIDHEIFFGEPPAEMPPQQQGQDVVLGVDDGPQHPVVFGKADKALELVHLPVQALFHLVERGHVRVAHPLDSARPQRESQMQKAQEQQLFVLPPGEKIPGDEGFRFGPPVFCRSWQKRAGLWRGR